MARRAPDRSRTPASTPASSLTNITIAGATATADVTVDLRATACMEGAEGTENAATTGSEDTAHASEEAQTVTA